MQVSYPWGRANKPCHQAAPTAQSKRSLHACTVQRGKHVTRPGYWPRGLQGFSPIAAHVDRDFFGVVLAEDTRKRTKLVQQAAGWLFNQVVDLAFVQVHQQMGQAACLS